MRSERISVLLSPLIGFAVCALIILFCAKTPAQALESLFTGVLSTPYYLGTMLNTASFLMLAGAGAGLALKGGNMNLGGEGQIYLGGYITCLVLNLPLEIPAVPKLLLALALCTAAGASLALVSAVLKETRGAQVLLTSFLASAAIIPLIDGLITFSKGPGSQNLLALPFIGGEFRLRQIMSPSPLSISFFIALFVCAACWIFLHMTSPGRKLQVWGTAPEFATYSGYSSYAVTGATMAVSGALHALTGFFAVCGTYYTCHKGFATGMGWNALSAALIVSSNPLALIPSAIVLGWLYTSADIVGLTQGFNFDISGIVQGCVLFSIAVPVIIRRTKKSGVKE